MLEGRNEAGPAAGYGAESGERRGRATIERWSAFRPALAVALGLQIALVALLLPRLWLFAEHSAAMIAFPWQIDYDEGVILHSSWLLANGENPYPDNDASRFVSSVYPPLFYGLNALAVNIGGLKLGSGRLLSLLGTLLAALALWGWVRAETRNPAAGVVAALFWLALGPVIVWASLYKQDILALGWGALGGWMVAAGTAVRGSRGLATRREARQLYINRTTYAAIIPFVLAFWTKQSALAPLAAAGIYLLLRDRRGGLRWCLVAGAALLLPYLALDLLLGGNITEHIFAPGSAALSADRLLKNLGALWGEYAVLVVLGFAGLAAATWTAVRHWSVPPLSAIFGLVSIPATLLSNMLPIANYNHLINGLLPICLLVGTLLGSLAPLDGRVAWRLHGLAGAVALALGLQALTFAPLAWWYTPLGQPLAEKAQRMAALDRLVVETPGPVLSEDLWLLLKNGKEVFYDDPAAMATYGGRGRWDSGQLLADVERRKFSLVILEYDLAGETYNPRWEQRVLEGLKENYITQFRDVRFVHVPRPAPAEPPQPGECPLPGGPGLAGYFLPLRGHDANPGDLAQLSLYWRGTEAEREPGLKITIKLLDAVGNALWQVDVPPGAAAGKPWPAIAAGELVRDDFLVQIPGDAPAGPYRLVLGAYTESNAMFRAVPFGCPAAGEDGAIVLAGSEIVKRE